ncbi:MAG: efflux transporter outer membrane subunit [Betaproteobacteria bacterium]|nr:efflux transporter outer membrane subunit [Betaproteobacteria bacterium]
MRSAIVMLAVLLMAGCSAGRDYVRPDAAAPAGWLAARDGAGIGGRVIDGRPEDTPREWWKGFADPALDRLIAAADAENFDLKRARVRVREARAARAATAAHLYPEVNLTPTAARGNAGQIGSDRTVSYFESAFDARWELDLFGATGRRVEAAEAQAQTAVEAEADVLLTLRGEVARNFVELRAAQNRLTLALETLRARRETAALVTSLRAAGLRSDLDVAQAQTQALSLAAQVPTLQTAVIAAARRLDTLLGRPPGATEAALPDAAPVPVTRVPAVLDEPATVIARRPDLKRAERELAAASALTAAATADLYPSVSLGGLFGFRNVAAGPAGVIWSIAGGLTAPLINFGRLEAQVDIADVRREQSYFAYRQAVLLALEEVETTLTAYVNSWRNVESLDNLVGNEQRKLALAEERYRKGLSPFIEVLDAQRSLYAAQSDRVSAQAELSRGYIALNKAVGG